ncbi:hypothetical protein EMPS_01873 [Entomortierella parvispora]|uniref:Uncharacterized protein n=1 Tax=Entomortierella parvispora TaxID=205924 RepID=A0A9P3H4D5_9FUNG|nr:hypothetical protein EMPS_01873 [Entomortierella parvispora]
MSKITGRGGTVDSAIFSVFNGPCTNKAGLREPSEFCGSAKSIACFAPWGHPNGVFDSVHKAVAQVVKDIYEGEKNPEIQAAMVEGVSNFCPVNCDDWIVPFQNIMLVWEQREHPKKYKVTPNCLSLEAGGI